jgi:hypothetical protein
MSSLEAFGGAGDGTTGGLSGRKRGCPLGSLNKAKDPAATPPVPRRRGRLPGSRNKKTLEALAAMAAAEPFRAGHSTAVVAAPGGAVSLAATNAAGPAAMTSVAGLTRTPLEAARPSSAPRWRSGLPLQASPARASAAPPARPLARRARGRRARRLGSGSPTS